jgi:hypothetical protein
MWFCDHSEWWGVWLLWRWCGVSWVTVGGCAAPPWEEGLTFGVVGDIHICVCMSNSCEVENDVLLPPRFAQRAGRRSQFVLADTLY